MDKSIVYLIISLALTHVQAQIYPACWIRNGECLDQNEGPLQIAIKPLINQNVIGNATSGVTSVDDCMNLCLAQPNCKYFTWYPLKTPPINETSCFLVGFNLRQACFNLANVCVLLKECEVFNSTCSTCQTGMRPLIDPKNEPLTVLMTGVTDNRFYKQQSQRQYSITKPNRNELIINLKVNKTCFFRGDPIVPRMGAVAGYFNGTTLVCGGYTFIDTTSDDSSMALGEYSNNCQKFLDRNTPWANTTSLNKKRAFASSVVTKNKFGYEEFYILGGYDRDFGFHDTVEKFSGNPSSINGSSWTIQYDMNLTTPKSHFCTVFVQDQYGVRYLYAIGGWNIQYLKSFERLTFNDTTNLVVNNNGPWQKLSDMYDARSDHACAFLQYEWSLGIMVAGGYGDGAWLRSVEFFDFKKAKWVKLPALTQGRHYHGLTTLGLIPMVFGGWNNGSLNSYEMIDFCQDPPAWTATQNFLQMKREKFAYARVPPSFTYNCD